MKELITLCAAVISAVAGAYFGDVFGAAIGAVIGWLIPILMRKVTTTHRLKIKILKLLDASATIQVRDLMIKTGEVVPLDCFPYDEKHDFVKSLSNFRIALLELEQENKVIFSPQTSVRHGYVDPPNDWINDWAGRAYKKNPSLHH